MDQHPLTRLQATAHEQVGPDGEEGFRQACGLQQPEAMRDWQGVVSGRQRVLRVTAPRQQGTDLFPQPRSRNTRPDGNNLACRFQTGQGGRPRRRRIFARPLQRIGPVHPGSSHPDQNLAQPGLGHGRDGGRQNLWPTGCRDRDNLHAFGQRSHGCSRPGRSSMRTGARTRDAAQSFICIRPRVAGLRRKASLVF